MHWALLVFLLAISTFVGLVWLAWLIRGASDQTLFQAMGLPLTSVFVLGHPLGMAAGAILWTSRVFGGRLLTFIKLATGYYFAACIYGLGGAYLTASLIEGRW